MGHVVSSGNWTRRYAYAEPSQITAAETGNRLTATSLPGDPAGRPVHRHVRARRARQHDADAAPVGDDLGRGRPAPLHYPERRRDAAGHLLRLRRQRPARPQGHRPAGRRPSSSRSGSTSARSRSTGSTPPTEPVTLERETLHVSDGEQAVALAENRTNGTDKGSAALFRYQHSNHLGSAVLELDDDGEHHHATRSTSRTAVRPTRPSLRRRKPRSATATPEKNATRKRACTTTAPAITHRGSAAGHRRTPLGSRTAQTCTHSSAATR